MIKDQCIDTIGLGGPSREVRVTWKSWLKSGVRLFVADFAKLVDVLASWQRRVRERNQLAQMSDHILKDVGLNRVDIEAEIRKSFWRA